MRRQTIVRSVRVDSELDNAIQKIARKNRTNYNSLVVSIFSKFVDWDNKAETFGYVSVPREILLLSLQSLDDETIKKIGYELGPTLIREMVQFWFGEVDLRSFMEHMALMSKYQQIANYEFTLSGTRKTITIHHYLGEKWSQFICSLYKSAMREIFAVDPEIEMTKNQIAIKWSEEISKEGFRVKYLESVPNN